PYQGELLKNISPPLGVFRLTIRFSIKMSPPLGVAYPGKHLSFRRKHYGFVLFLVSVSSFVGFGYFWASKVTMKWISLKRAKALRIRVVFGICELLRRFGAFGLQK